MQWLCAKLWCASLTGGLLGAQMEPLFGRNTSRPLMDPYNGFTDSNGSSQSIPRDSSDPRYFTDMFASVGLNAQFGQFERRFLDFTKLGVRLDVGAASALKSAISSKSQIPSSHGEPGGTSSKPGCPTLALSLQQQVRSHLFSLLLSMFSNIVVAKLHSPLECLQFTPHPLTRTSLYGSGGGASSCTR